MGHLNKLHEEYASKGLVVLGVSNEDAGKVEGWVSEHGADFPIIVEESDSAEAYGSSGFPSSFIVGSDGNIAWSGHPGSIKEDQIEELLTSVVYFPDLPKALNSVRKALSKGKYASAHGLLTKAIDGGKLTEEEADIATKMRDWIDAGADGAMTSAAKKIDSEDYYSAWKTYDRVAKEYKGLAVAARAKDLAKAMLKNKEQKLEIGAGKKFAKIKKKLRDLSPKKAVAALKALTGKKYGDTKAGKEATKLSVKYEAKLN